MTDLLPVILNGTLQLVLLVLGAYVSLKPPKTRLAQNGCLAAFALFGITGIGVSIWQHIRDSTASEALAGAVERVEIQTKEPPRVSVAVSPPNITVQAPVVQVQFPAAGPPPPPPPNQPTDLERISRISDGPPSLSVIGTKVTRDAESGRQLFGRLILRTTAESATWRWLFSSARSERQKRINESCCQLVKVLRCNWQSPTRVRKKSFRLAVRLELTYDASKTERLRYVYRGQLMPDGDRLRVLEAETLRLKPA